MTIIDSNKVNSIKCPRCKNESPENEMLSGLSDYHCYRPGCEINFPYIFGLFSKFIENESGDKYEEFIGSRITFIQSKAKLLKEHRISFPSPIRYPDFIKVGFLQNHKINLDNRLIITKIETTNEYVDIILTPLDTREYPESISVIVQNIEPYESEYYINHLNEVLLALKQLDYKTALIKTVTFYDSFLDYYIEEKINDKPELFGEKVCKSILNTSRMNKLSFILPFIINSNFIKSCPKNDVVKKLVDKRNCLVHPKSYNADDVEISEEIAKKALNDVIEALCWILEHDIKSNI